jgi:hypothetical protein
VTPPDRQSSVFFGFAAALLAAGAAFEAFEARVALAVLGFVAAAICLIVLSLSRRNRSRGRHWGSEAPERLHWFWDTNAWPVFGVLCLVGGPVGGGALAAGLGGNPAAGALAGLILSHLIWRGVRSRAPTRTRDTP